MSTAVLPYCPVEEEVHQMDELYLTPGDHLPGTARFDVVAICWSCGLKLGVCKGFLGRVTVEILEEASAKSP